MHHEQEQMMRFKSRFVIGCKMNFVALHCSCSIIDYILMNIGTCIKTGIESDIYTTLRLKCRD